MKIAFYAPIKPPDHPIPSGDRLIARNLMAAFTMAGHDVDVASRFIAYSKREDADILRQKRKDALAEAEAVAERLGDDPPDVWITYHPYCKAPDWIGAAVSQKLAIPYVNVEAAKTGQGFENGQDRWAAWRKEAQAGIRQADLQLCFKPSDRSYLTGLLGEGAPIAELSPFMDTDLPEHLPEAELPSHWRKDWPVLLAVGMMRPGKKVENYRLLSQSLERLQALPWNFVAVGGGPEEGTIRSFFNGVSHERLHFVGGVAHERVLSLMAESDLFVWPGWREPIGMVYLEAQLSGLPVAAFDSLGVPLVVRHGETGLLAPEGDIEALARHIGQFVSHPALRSDYADRAPPYVQSNHSLASAANHIDRILRERLELA